MTHVVVLGGTRHIGGHLVPRLVAAGPEVTVLTRGVEEEAAGTFGARVRDLEPDVVIDLICFTRRQCAAPRRRAGRACGYPPRRTRRPFGEYDV